MNCVKCGKNIDDDSKFCVHCGFNQAEQPELSKNNLASDIKDDTENYKDILPSESYNQRLEDRINIRKDILEILLLLIAILLSIFIIVQVASD